MMVTMTKVVLMVVVLTTMMMMVTVVATKNIIIKCKKYVFFLKLKIKFTKYFFLILKMSRK